jgi:hypothetical protein
MSSEAAASQKVIRQLRETLASRNALLPEAANSAALDTQPLDNLLASCSMGGTTFPSQRLEFHFPSSSYRSPTANRETQPTNLVNNPNAIVNFVLSLEQPCIYHHRMPSPELLITGSISATGHSSMLSSPVMARAPTFKFNPLSFGYPPNIEWQTPTIELEQLLETSQRLDLDAEEVTPIQIWSLIRQNPKFDALTTEHLDILGTRLHTFVKCYGSVFFFLRS